MSAGAIGGTTSGSAVTDGSGAFGKLKTEDFIKVMISELSHQDPFQPQDSSKLLEQFSSLRNIESQLGLQQQLESLVLQNSVSMAGGLIGQMVKGLDENNTNVEGLVKSVRVTDGKAMLELDNGKTLSMSKVTEIAPPASTTATTPATAA